MGIFGSTLDGFSGLPWLARALSGIGLKGLFPLHIQCKLNETVKNDDVTLSGRRDVDLHKRLRAVQGRMGSIRFWYVDFKRGFLTLNYVFV